MMSALDVSKLLLHSVNVLGNHAALSPHCLVARLTLRNFGAHLGILCISALKLSMQGGYALAIFSLALLLPLLLLPN